MSNKMSAFWLAFCFIGVLGVHSEEITLVTGLSVPFDNDHVSFELTRQRITTNGKLFVISRVFRFTIGSLTSGCTVFARVDEDAGYNLQTIKDITGIDEVFNYAGVSAGSYETMRSLSGDHFDSVQTNNGRLSIERYIGPWSTGPVVDLLAYIIKISGFYDLIVVHFYNIGQSIEVREAHQLSPAFVSRQLQQGNESFAIYETIHDAFRNLSIDRFLQEKVSGVVTDDRVRLRSRPDLNADVIGYLQANDRVTILEATDTEMQTSEMRAVWYHVVTTQEQAGWVYGHFIEVQ